VTQQTVHRFVHAEGANESSPVIMGAPLLSTRADLLASGLQRPRRAVHSGPEVCSSYTDNLGYRQQADPSPLYGSVSQWLIVGCRHFRAQPRLSVTLTGPW
jgi:hypothetical protein